MTEIPLIAEKEVDALGPASTYVAPKVALPAPKNIPTLESLPSNPAQREQVLQTWTQQLKAWQENLENHSSSPAVSSADRKVILPFFCVCLDVFLFLTAQLALCLLRIRQV